MTPTFHSGFKHIKHNYHYILFYFVELLILNVKRISHAPKFNWTRENQQLQKAGYDNEHIWEYLLEKSFKGGFFYACHLFILFFLIEVTF